MDDRRCSNCGHRMYGRVFCSDCGLEFCCGSVGEPCQREGCADMVIAEQYRSESDVEEARRVVAGERPQFAAKLRTEAPRKC